MEKSRSRVGQMVRWHARKSQSYVRTVSVDLNRKTEETFGSVFGIFETETDSRTADALIAYIEDAVLRSINDAVRRKAERTREEIFESAIYAANHAVARLLDERNLPLDPRKMKSVLVSQRGHDVILGIWGSPSVLLFHPSAKNGTVRTFDLLDDRRPDHEKPLHQRSFRRGYTNVISGGIGKRDRLLLSTEDPRTLLNETTLSSIIIGEDPQSAAEALKETLGNLSPRLSFASLVIDAAIPEAPAQDGLEENGAAGTQGSINALLDTTSRTRDILSPSFVTGVWRRISGGFGAVVSDLRERGFRHTKGRRSEGAEERRGADTPHMSSPAPHLSSSAPPVLAAQPNSLPSASDPRTHGPHMSSSGSDPRTHDTDQGSGEGMSGGGDDMPPEETPPETAGFEPEPEQPAEKEEAVEKVSVLDTAKEAVRLVTDGEHRSAAIAEKRQAFRDRVKTFIDRFNAMTKRRRALLLAALVLAFVLNQGVAVAAWQHQSERKLARYERSVRAIDQKLDSAEASIIYRDQDRARSLLAEAEGLVAELPAKTDMQNAEIARLTGRIDEKRNDLRHAVPLTSSEVLATIVANGGDVRLSRIAVRNGVIWSLGADGGVYRTVPDTGLTERAGNAPEGNASYLVTGSAGIIAGTTGGAARSFAFVSNKASDLTVSFGDTAPSLEDAETYGPRLYVLDAAHNRILKHNPYSGGFGAPSQYLKDGTDVSQAVSIAIDGLVYVLKKDGGVTRILQGVKDDFGVQAADPPVMAAKKVRTTENSDTLYVLDTAPGRVLAYSKKTGSLLAQYMNDELAEATDFMVENGTTLYATVGNRVLKFEIPKE